MYALAGHVKNMGPIDMVPVVALELNIPLLVHLKLKQIIMRLLDADDVTLTGKAQMLTEPGSYVVLAQSPVVTGKKVCIAPDEG